MTIPEEVLTTVAEEVAQELLNTLKQLVPDTRPIFQRPSTPQVEGKGIVWVKRIASGKYDHTMMYVGYDESHDYVSSPVIVITYKTRAITDDHSKMFAIRNLVRELGFEEGYVGTDDWIEYFNDDIKELVDRYSEDPQFLGKVL